MEKYIFTPAGYRAIVEKIKKLEAELNRVTETKAEAGVGQDDWHDEQFQRAMIEEEIWDRRLREFRNILSRAQVIEPEEQDKIIQLGNGVCVQYENGSLFRFIVEGCILGMSDGPNFVSINSPLGQAILGASVGEEISFLVGETKRTITIKQILPPFRVNDIFREQ